MIFGSGGEDDFTVTIPVSSSVIGMSKHKLYASVKFAGDSLMCGGCCSQHWHFKINLHLDFWVHKNKDLNQGLDLTPGASLL